MDREKVIKAIDICLGHGKCDDCGYRIKGGYSTMDCRKPMMRDALALLKEQEEQRPTKQASALMADHHYYACPKCGCMVDYLVWKCYACNQKLNWD